MSEPKTCGECRHGLWQRTPTGRIRKNTVGSCDKVSELLKMYVHERHAPCMSTTVIGAPMTTRIWPDADASGCPMKERL